MLTHQLYLIAFFIFQRFYLQSCILSPFLYFSVSICTLVSYLIFYISVFLFALLYLISFFIFQRFYLQWLLYVSHSWPPDGCPSWFVSTSPTRLYKHYQPLVHRYHLLSTTVQHFLGVDWCISYHDDCGHFVSCLS